MSKSIEPSGPICAFGSRLAYTYFPTPAPHPDLLNSLASTPSTTPSSNSSGTDAGQLDGSSHWFTIDDQLVYLSFFQDYGPLNIGCLYRFCLHLHNLLEDPAHRHQRIFLYSSDEPDKKVNAALLMSLYAMVVMRWSVADVLHPISCLELQPYRDAGYSRSDYHLHPQQILYGLSRALSHQLLDLSTFDLAAYEKAEKVEEGDWNWITPGFLAFASPVEAGWNPNQPTSAVATSAGRLTRSFRNVLEEFENKGVKVVVRLNKKLYDRNHFLERGIDHVEMYFDDGTNPTMEMCREFIDLSDKVISAGGAVAVHCKAGLGRTGTLIGAYLIYKHGFTADEAIGFMRLMRPGSCVGPQQHFLYENQLEWVKWSAQDELRTQLALSDNNTSNSVRRNHETDVEIRAVEPRIQVERECSQPPPIETPRPITPPNETELARHRSTTPHHARAPMTPRRQIVPGQPRKTPGRSRHGVAAPEEKDSSPQLQQPTEEDEGMDEVEAAIRNEEEMEGVILSSPRKPKRDSLEGSAPSIRRTTRKSLQLTQDEEDLHEDSITMMPSPKKLDLEPSVPISSAAVTAPRTLKPPTASSTRPTRIAKSQPSTSKPLGPTTLDNRLRTRTASASNSQPSLPTDTSSIARSKGAKNLNNVFEEVEGTTRSRYPLRNVSGRTSPTGIPPPPPPATSTTLPTTQVVVPPNSPTKLPTSRMPTRVPAKRGVPPSSPVPKPNSTGPKGGGSGHSKDATGPTVDPKSTNGPAKAAGGFTSLAHGLAKLHGQQKGRNVRRRRSSMGSQDFVQAG